MRRGLPAAAVRRQGARPRCELGNGARILLCRFVYRLSMMIKFCIQEEERWPTNVSVPRGRNRPPSWRRRAGAAGTWSAGGEPASVEMHLTGFASLRTDAAKLGTARRGSAPKNRVSSSCPPHRVEQPALILAPPHAQFDLYLVGSRLEAPAQRVWLFARLHPSASHAPLPMRVASLAILLALIAGPVTARSESPARPRCSPALRQAGTRAGHCR